MLSDLPEPANDPGWTVGRSLGAGLAVAAAAVLVVALHQPAGSPPGSPAEQFQVRGGELGLEVFRRTAGPSDMLVDGAVVHAGDSLGFRLSVRRAGWVLLAGVDG